MPPANAPKTPPKKKNTSWDCAPVEYLTCTANVFFLNLISLWARVLQTANPGKHRKWPTATAHLSFGKTGWLSPSVDCRHACLESSGVRFLFVVIMFPTLSTFKCRKATIVHHEWAAHKQSSCSSSQIKDSIDKTWKPVNTWVSTSSHSNSCGIKVSRASLVCLLLHPAGNPLSQVCLALFSYVCQPKAWPPSISLIKQSARFELLHHSKCNAIKSMP